MQGPRNGAVADATETNGGGMTIGEVIAMSDHVMEGYYKEPQATEAVMGERKDGHPVWLHTGDMAVWDEESYIHIVDRQKEIIISGGENISSLEVERAIFAHPAVFECAVVAAPDGFSSFMDAILIIPLFHGVACIDNVAHPARASWRKPATHSPTPSRPCPA